MQVYLVEVGSSAKKGQIYANLMTLQGLFLNLVQAKLVRAKLSLSCCKQNSLAGFIELIASHVIIIAD